MDLIIPAMDNVIFQDLDLLLTIISLILNTFHVLKKNGWRRTFINSRDIQNKILNDILKMPPNVNIRTFGIKRSTLIILF